MTVDTPTVAATGSLAEIQTLVARIYGPEGCLWAQGQTHFSLRKYVLEEASEVLQILNEMGPVPLPSCFTTETISSQHAQHLAEELGDLLYQVLVHAVLAEREGLFTLDDVLAGLHAKLLRRHPHVFGNRTALSLADVEAIWAEVKASEQALERIPTDG